MSPIIMLLVAASVTLCWSSPQRRNWTPQAILYLKGAQGHRSVLERTTREEGRTLRVVTYNQDGDKQRSSLTPLLQRLLQGAVEEGGGNADIYPEEQELSLKFL